MEDACSGRCLPRQQALTEELGKRIRQWQERAASCAEQARAQWTDQMKLATDAVKGTRQRLHWLGGTSRRAERPASRGSWLEVSSKFCW